MATRNKFDIRQLLQSGVAARVYDMPAADDTVGQRSGSNSRGSSRRRGNSMDDPPKYDITTSPAEMTEYVNGTPLYRKDHRGIWYFMPVYLKHKRLKAVAGEDTAGDNHNQEGIIQLQNAVVKVTHTKTYKSTAIPGRGISIKEQITADSKTVEIQAILRSEDNTYPVERIRQIKELYDLNESVEIISVLTDLLLDPDDKVVLERLEFPDTEPMEDMVQVKMVFQSDKDFELVIKS